MADTLTFTGDLVVLTCWCGMHHAIPSQLRVHQNQEADEGRRFLVYCPLGHNHYPSNADGPTKAARERQRTEAMERRAVNAENAARIQREIAEKERRSAAALRGHLTRIRTRIAAGICPVPGCRRSGFAKVRDHLEAKHPDWLAEHVHDLDET